MDMKFMAAVHGIDLDDKSDDPGITSTSDDRPKSKPTAKSSAGTLTFKDPAEYEKMSQAEREELTKQMMSHWTRWASDSSLEKANGHNAG